MTGAQRRTQERDELRAGMGWALVRAFERFRATDEHLHTAAWFLDRHVGFDVALEDFASARGAHQGPFSETFARTVTSDTFSGSPAFKSPSVSFSLLPNKLGLETNARPCNRNSWLLGLT